MKKNNDDFFRFVEYSAENAERTGYSNYSYWRCVFQNFLKKKSAVHPPIWVKNVVFYNCSAGTVIIVN